MTDNALVPLDPAIEQALQEANCNLQVGDVFGSSYDGFCRLDGFTMTEYGVHARITVVESGESRDRALNDLPKDPVIVPGGDLEAARQRAYETLMNGLPEEDQTTAPGSAVATASTAAVVQFHIDAMEQRRQSLELYQYIVKRDLSRLNSAIQEMKKQLQYMRRIITAIELYAGFYEEVVQISDGAPAPISEPVRIFQRVLFMDEEVGIADFFAETKQHGIDWQNIDEFDRWLISSQANLDWVAPTAKCIVALRPSRQERHYHENPFEDAFFNANNRRLYLLVRNGEKVYRIFPSVMIGEELFPTIEEMEAVLDHIDRGGIRSERAKNTDLDYKTLALLLQGIFDRTDLMEPLPRPVLLTDPNDYDYGHFFLVRDAESLIGDGHVPFKQWRTELNLAAGVGSRVVVGNIDWRTARNANRFKRYYASDAGLPSPPSPGLYQIMERKESKYGSMFDSLYILYNPGDTIYSSGWTWEEPHERKNRLSWALSPRDEFWLNYDGLDTDDIEFYLRNRVDREGYLDMIPLLQEIYKQRAKERPLESAFVTLMAERIGVPEQTVWDAVEWWKTKNKWKRPLMEDDAKAWRMIEKRIAKGMQS